MLKKLKVWQIWVIFAAVFILGIGVIILTPFTQSPWTTVCIIALALILLFLTFWIQYAAKRTFVVKRKLKSFQKKIYNGNNDLEPKLIENKFKARDVSYGKSYLLIKDKIAYKVSLIKDCTAYKNNVEEDNKGKANSELNKCVKFIGLEVFYNPDEEMKLNMTDYTIQGEKVYFTALAFIDNTYVCLNYEEPLDQFKDIYNDLFKMLELEELIEE